MRLMHGNIKTIRIKTINVIIKTTIIINECKVFFLKLGKLSQEIN